MRVTLLNQWLLEQLVILPNINSARLRHQKLLIWVGWKKKITESFYLQSKGMKTEWWEKSLLARRME